MIDITSVVFWDYTVVFGVCKYIQLYLKFKQASCHCLFKLAFPQVSHRFSKCFNIRSFYLCFVADPSLISCSHPGSSPWCLGSGWLTLAIGLSPPLWCCWPCTEATCAPWGVTATWRGKNSSSWLRKTRILKSSKTDGCASLRRHGRLFFLVAVVLHLSLIIGDFCPSGDPRWVLWTSRSMIKHHLYVLWYIKCFWPHNASNCLRKKNTEIHERRCFNNYIWTYISTGDFHENLITDI